MATANTASPHAAVITGPATLGGSSDCNLPASLQVTNAVGTNVGEIRYMGSWPTGKVGTKNLQNIRLLHVYAGHCLLDSSLSKSCLIQNVFVKDPTVGVNRSVWSSDGSLLGVGFSKYIVHLYLYNGGGDLRQHLEMKDVYRLTVNNCFQQLLNLRAGKICNLWIRDPLSFSTPASGCDKNILREK